LKAGVDEASASTRTSMQDFKAMVEEKDETAGPSSTEDNTGKTSPVSSTDDSSKKSD